MKCLKNSIYLNFSIRLVAINDFFDIYLHVFLIFLFIYSKLFDLKM